VRWSPATCGSAWRSTRICAGIEIAESSQALRDDQTAAKDLVFGIWPAQGPVDGTTVLAIAPAWGGMIRLGEPSICAPSNFTLSAARPARFQIAPIDLAGNVGTPAEITIDPTGSWRTSRQAPCRMELTALTARASTAPVDGVHRPQRVAHGAQRILRVLAARPDPQHLPAVTVALPRGRRQVLPGKCVGRVLRIAQRQHQIAKMERCCVGHADRRNL
jgi:hypothetical protein